MFSVFAETVFSILARIQNFPDTRPDSTISRYSHAFYPFSVFAKTVFSILAQILPFPDTHPDSTIFRYSHRFDPFPVLPDADRKSVV